MDYQVKAVRTGFPFFKKVHFEISYGTNPVYTDYCYSLADLSIKLLNMGVNKDEVWRILNKYESTYYICKQWKIK